MSRVERKEEEEEEEEEEITAFHSLTRHFHSFKNQIKSRRRVCCGYLQCGGTIYSIFDVGTYSIVRHRRQADEKQQLIALLKLIDSIRINILHK